MTIRTWLAIAAALLVTACASNKDLEDIPPPLGDFRLGHAIAITDKIEKGPFSRELDPAKIKTAVESAVRARLAPPRYDGDGLYHLGIFVGGMMLAQPGIPIIYQPKSAMVVEVNIFDNRTQQKLNEEPQRLTVFEGLENSAPLIGSGMVRDGDAQLANLSTSLARAIENWLNEHPEWFEPVPGKVRVPYPQDTGTEALAETAPDASDPA